MKKVILFFGVDHAAAAEYAKRHGAKAKIVPIDTPSIAKLSELVIAKCGGPVAYRQRNAEGPTRKNVRLTSKVFFDWISVDPNKVVGLVFNYENPDMEYSPLPTILENWKTRVHHSGESIFVDFLNSTPVSWQAA